MFNGGTPTTPTHGCSQHTHTPTHTHTHPHTHTPTHTHTHTLSLSLLLTHTHTTVLSILHGQTHSLTLTCILSLSPTQTLTRMSCVVISCQCDQIRRNSAIWTIFDRRLAHFFLKFIYYWAHFFLWLFTIGRIFEKNWAHFCKNHLVTLSLLRRIFSDVAVLIDSKGRV